MPTEYDEAVTALYQAPLESFVAERQRLSSALKASGDKAGAARVAKLARPSVSAWAVNQLWWHARPAFEELFETAAQLRAGKLAASGAHRKAVAALGARAQQLLTEGGHAESPGTLRRITMTLSGLAAAGGFEPEPAGALSKDRDPPGFEALGGGSESESESAEPAAEERHAKKPDEHAAAAAKQAREAAAAEKKRVAEERAQRAAERKDAEAALRDAKAELREREHARERVAKELAAADSEVTRARAAVEAAEARLAAVKSED
ncbi:MAG TPA: hypothetical protein VNW92_20845 [Polyangiaceae bacterium]|jgi:hypothetical protein|nr:hypothetical protein [Polyangiaceae bacterium]